MRQLFNKQKRAESDNSNLQKKLKDLKNDLNNTNSTLAEKDGVNLNMEKELLKQQLWVRKFNMVLDIVIFLLELILI